MPSASDSQSASTASKDLVVFSIIRESKCAECGEELWKGRFHSKEEGKPLCLRCADRDRFVYLERGDSAVARRAKKYSALSAAVVRFSRTRGRYERQGLLVEESALQRAEAECLSDADQRAARRERDELRRTEEDHDLCARVADAIRELFPGSPPREAIAIAALPPERGARKARLRPLSSPRFATSTRATTGY